MSEPQSAPNDEGHLRTALAAAKADVLGALEAGVSLSQSQLIELRRSVEEPIERYQALLQATPAERHPKLEHTLGRQVIDLKRLAARLPQMVSGTAAKTSVDRIPGGGQPFIETRAPPKSIVPARAAPSIRGPRTLGPGDEVEAWCGPCNGLRTHSIIAMVGKAPKQVVCGSCGGRHGYRLTPARAKPSDDAPRKSAPAAQVPMRKTPERLEEERRAQERERLRAELSAAQDVVMFDPRRRYKSGQVIDHPEHGRGKIENVVRSSLLVRFPIGLRTLMTK